jgi:hypothetical protein
MSAEGAGSSLANIRDVKATGYQSECGGSMDGERRTCLRREFRHGPPWQGHVFRCARSVCASNVKPPSR